MASYRPTIGYGFNQQLPVLPPSPVVANRAPKTSDINYALGTVWVYAAQNEVFLLSSVVSNSANWVNVSEGSGAFSSLSVSPGPISFTGTTTINTSGSAVTTIGTGGTGAVNIGNSTGNTSVTGSLSASTTLTAATGITATTGNIAASSGNLSASGTVTGGTGVIATTGNVTATNGNLVLSTAATYISMPGPVFIYSGAGVPSNGLALHVGDMYINTTAASATTRLYIATAASAWVNVTCAG